jgi:hypothetical protein
MGASFLFQVWRAMSIVTVVLPARGGDSEDRRLREAQIEAADC